jgi:hypothetical protein
LRNGDDRRELNASEQALGNISHSARLTGRSGECVDKSKRDDLAAR